jgi:hypothetical protein
MNKQVSLLSAAVVAMSLSASAGADTLAQWDFESTTPADASNIASYPNAIAPAIGIGNASGIHASATTDWTTPAGNGSANSFSSNEWAIGDYYQFQTSTIGFENITVSWDQTSSSTGPRDFKLSYSTDGSIFSDFASYSVRTNSSPAWSSSTPTGLDTFTYDLSTINAIENQTSVYFRLVDASMVAANGGTVASGGTDRVDNFTISAAPVPEADTYAMLLAGLGLVGFMVRRRKA